MVFITKYQEWIETPYIASVCILVLVVHLWWVWNRKLPVYLLDFQVYKPPDRSVTESEMLANCHLSGL